MTVATVGGPGESGATVMCAAVHGDFSTVRLGLSAPYVEAFPIKCSEVADR